MRIALISDMHGNDVAFRAAAEDIVLPESEGDAVVPFQLSSVDLLAGGHTHRQWTRRIGEALFVNPGSIGLAYDHHQPEGDFKLSPVAEYAIVFVERAGLSVEFRRVRYSVDELRKATAAGGRPHAGDYMSQ